MIVSINLITSYFFLAFVQCSWIIPNEQLKVSCLLSHFPDKHKCSNIVVPLTRIYYCDIFLFVTCCVKNTSFWFLGDLYLQHSTLNNGPSIINGIFHVNFLPGHNASHMQITPIEKVFNKNKDALKLRESEWIKEFGTLVPRGMNIKS